MVPVRFLGSGFIVGFGDSFCTELSRIPIRMFEPAVYLGFIGFRVWGLGLWLRTRWKTPRRVTLNPKTCKALMQPPGTLCRPSSSKL